MLALALIAVGVFMGVVLYGNGDGGRLGHALAVALGWSVGRSKVLAPIALVGAGTAMLMRPVLPAMRPLRTGSICLFAAIVLALAAGTLGVSSGQGTPASHWSSVYLQAHGGAGGQALYEVAHRLVQQVGVDILVVFLLVVGVILLTGASLAAVLRATGSGMVDSTRMLKARVAADRGAGGDSSDALASGSSRARAADPIEGGTPLETLLPPIPSRESWWCAPPTWRRPHWMASSRWSRSTRGPTTRSRRSRRSSTLGRKNCRRPRGLMRRRASGPPAGEP